MELMTERVEKQTERETLRRPDRFAVSGGSDRKWGKKREQKKEADQWERSMANKSSSNHDRNQMYMKDREREEDD